MNKYWYLMLYFNYCGQVGVRQ